MIVSVHNSSFAVMNYFFNFAYVMKHFYSLLLFGSLISLSSCASIGSVVLSPVMQTTPRQTLSHVSKWLDTARGRELILVPMVHRGKAKDYAAIKDYLDTLKARGYVLFCEGCAAVPFHIDTIADVSMPNLQILKDTLHLTGTDSIRLDTLLRKFRRLTRLNLQHLYDASKLQILQSGEVLGMTTDQDLWVDYTLADLLEVYEKERGEVLLTQYDFDTPLGDKYKRPKKLWQNRDALLIAVRNRYLERRIVESSHPKIAVVYGAGHFLWISHDLRWCYGYTKDKTYNAKKLF